MDLTSFFAACCWSLLLVRLLQPALVTLVRKDRIWQWRRFIVIVTALTRCGVAVGHTAALTLLVIGRPALAGTELNTSKEKQWLRHRAEITIGGHTNSHGTNCGLRTFICWSALRLRRGHPYLPSARLCDWALACDKWWRVHYSSGSLINWRPVTLLVLVIFDLSTRRIIMGLLCFVWTPRTIMRPPLPQHVGCALFLDGCLSTRPTPNPLFFS